ncbi:uncharacterized protein LOC112552946 isoform X1 [Pogonomyrmex barbatus]|uniref:Uncharacterized protein LOC112552946 isoform X1 n=1 Tax=Pogonomyrmex barbatus TaxID=144034 RepID=A0A8N1S988_9HYME|nr:uncharacterized protein LOC112552946 isoform X1 [Pogonomyrmex barbatus]
MEIWDISHNRTSLQRRLFVIERSSHFFLPGATRHSFISVEQGHAPSCFPLVTGTADGRYLPRGKVFSTFGEIGGNGLSNKLSCVSFEHIYARYIPCEMYGNERRNC